jgi:hypothetical protein
MGYVKVFGFSNRILGAGLRLDFGRWAIGPSGWIGGGLRLANTLREQEAMGGLYTLLLEEIFASKLYDYADEVIIFAYIYYIYVYTYLVCLADTNRFERIYC